MGLSSTILEKDFMVLSLEIDNDITIEFSTGFGNGKTPQFSATMPVKIEEITEIIDRLTILKNRILNGWKCKVCDIINLNSFNTECCNCHARKGEESKVKFTKE